MTLDAPVDAAAPALASVPPSGAPPSPPAVAAAPPPLAPAAPAAPASSSLSIPDSSSGEACLSCASVACLSTHTASSMPAALSRVVVLSPYRHVKMVCTVSGNEFAAVTERHSKFTSLIFIAGDPPAPRGGFGLDCGSLPLLKARYKEPAIFGSSRFTEGRFVSQTHRRRSRSSPSLETSWSASHDATR